MPSSSDDVATRHGISPFFRSSSISSRCSRASDPWWARAISRRSPSSTSSFASSFRRSARRSASRRLLTKTIVERCCLDELQDLRVDRGPDRAGLAGLPHVLERDDDLQVELLRAAGVDELDRPPAGDEASDLLHRPLRRREPDALDGLLGQAVEALDGEGHVCAALRAGDGVHLVEDQRLDRLQHLAPARGEQEVERLRGRDQDVRVLAEHRGAVALRRVAGADRDAELRAEPGQRSAEVPLHVVVQSLQRRDVEQAEPLARVRQSACRSRTGRRRGSSPSRSAPGSACACRSRSRASPALALGWARRRRLRTRPVSSD